MKKKKILNLVTGGIFILLALSILDIQIQNSCFWIILIFILIITCLHFLNWWLVLQ